MQPKTLLTRPPDGLMMSKEWRITKQQRRDERVEMGKLTNLVVKPDTLAKYRQQFNLFHDWAACNDYPLTTSLEVDAAAAQFIEALWADGCERAEASYLLASIQKHVPHFAPFSSLVLAAGENLA